MTDLPEGRPMPTLLSVNNYYYRRGGAETVFLEHNRLFEDLGWQVVPFAMHHANNIPTPWSRHFIDEIEFGSDYTLAQKAARAPKVIYSLEARRRLRSLLAEANPGLCHAHNIYHHISPSILGLLRDRGIPTVLTLHDLKIACPAYSMLARDGICERCRGGRLHNVVLHRCIKDSLALSAVVFAEAVLHRLIGSYRRCVDRFVVPSRFYIDKLCEWGLPRASFTHVPNFVDVGAYEPNFAPGDHFIYFGRLSREKGLATLVRAAAIARRPLRIAGTGPQQEELRTLAASVGADVSFMGYLTGTALHAAIRGARAVVLPSEWYENAPMSVLEAYALGKPVIGAGIGGIPELVRETQTGEIFRSGDAESLASVLRGFGDRTDVELARMGECGRDWVATDFSAARYRERVAQIYADLGVR